MDGTIVKAVLVDIDDTLLNTDTRRWTAWRDTLGREISSRMVKSKGSRQILKIYAQGREDIWNKFWGLLLCFDDRGRELLSLDTPLEGSVDVITRWEKKFRIVYITGRTENMRELTLTQLEGFGFPSKNSTLLMCSSINDFLESAVDVRRNLIHNVVDKYRFERVIDDNPVYFPVYREFHIPVRVGFIRAARYSPSDFEFSTHTIVSWWEMEKISGK